MSNDLQLKDLRARYALAWRSAGALTGFALLALVIALAHVEAGAGADMRDVHVPVDWLRGITSFSYPLGEPYDAALRGMNPALFLPTIVVVFGQFVFIGSLIWALIKKKRQIVMLSLLVLSLIAIFAPVPKFFVQGVAKAVSVETAERLLTQKQDPTVLFRLADEHAKVAATYVRAQIAYVKGDRARARELSANVNLISLGSPIEAPYRLQFLQGRYANLTTVCFVTFGCLNEQQRQDRLALFACITALLLLAAIASAAFSLHLAQRLTRVDALLAYARETSVKRSVMQSPDEILT